MIHFSPEELSERDNYKFMIGSIIPRPIALITSMSKADVLNIAPFSYFNIVTSNPPIVSVAFQRKNGQKKDTAKNILDNKEAVIHVVDTENVEDANQTAATLPASESELGRTTFTLEQSDKINVPSLKEAKIRFEVELFEHVEVEEDGIVGADLLLLKIKEYHIKQEIYETGRINPDGLGAISRLAGHDYAEVGHRFTIKRPD